MDDKGWVLFASLATVLLGALELVGILHFIPDCQFGWNFVFVSGCSGPIIWFGLDPNVVAGAVLASVGFLLLVFGEKAVE